MPQLFVYGSLLEESVLKQVIGRMPVSTTGTVKGFRKDTIHIDGEDWFIAVPDVRMSMLGKFLTLDASELILLDEWEGPEYQRQEINDDVYIYAQPDRLTE
jgi:gamma-glutamylcyclotransferase (GGCT)/AIG2-like uncharacterized protein YtfP